MKALKALPCRHCGQPALLPNGQVYTMYGLGQDQRTFMYKCSRCKKKTEIRVSEFNALPEYKEK